ncbi:uncharacterized protein G2W53_011278 [Senna tora]|uniref:Uncharacterized protein n=1 Tax=Senna tora TaxID=362788 RepID=A0A834X1W4_9FABA|nr:uncharacterized protein G2W53_011278 [Senna tora]
MDPHFCLNRKACFPLKGEGRGSK